MDEAAKAVEMLLERNGISIKRNDCPDGVDVVPSKIPYRNW
jgi:transcriptional regulator CtsR